MTHIQLLAAREILDSRGWPTVEVDMVFDSSLVARAAVPSGASTGAYEAIELRDEDRDRYLGRGVQKAVRNILEKIAPKLKGFPVGRQEDLDRLLIDLDGTPNKKNLGANALLAVSLAYAKGSAAAGGVALYRYLALLMGQTGDLRSLPLPLTLPLPMMNVINGGRHADNGLTIQEFMILPCGPSYRESLRMGVEVFQHLKKILSSRELSTAVGDEGGFAPQIDSNREVLQLLCEATQKAGFKVGKEILFALDVASSEIYQKGQYHLKTEEGEKREVQPLIAYYQKLVNEFPLVSIEDGMAEDDWEGWKKLTASLGKKIQLVGDDLFVTNPERLKKGIESKIANAILIKLNQIGTLSETLKVIRLAQEAGYRTVISHRSGETEDSTIADLAVGSGVAQIKTGGLSRSERLAKYNQLLRIEEELGPRSRFPGRSIFS